jgi:hypothetical protein
VPPNVHQGILGEQSREILFLPDSSRHPGQGPKGVHHLLKEDAIGTVQGECALDGEAIPAASVDASLLRYRRRGFDITPAATAHRQSTRISGAADRIRDWLLSDDVQIRGGDHDGGVLGWVSTNMEDRFVYPEIMGYYLTWLAFVAEEDDRWADRCAERAHRALDWLRRGRGGWLTRDYLTSSNNKDWRNFALFTFDLGMLLGGIGHWVHSHAFAAELQVVALRELDGISPFHGLLGSHALRAGHDEHALPRRWSTVPGPHHVKVAAHVDLSRPAHPGLLALAERTREHWTGIMTADRGTIDVHPVLYFLEGLVLHASATDRELPLDLLDAILSRILTGQHAEGDLAERANPRGGLRRADVTAQALRLCAILLARDNRAGHDTLPGQARSLCTALLDRYLHEGGGVTSFPSRGDDSGAANPPNVWTTIFTYQALRLYESVLRRTVAPPALVRRLA